MVNYSLGEIDALARKATRGAGYSWGIAEETGKSVRWLSAYGFSGAELLSKHLLLTQDENKNFAPKLLNKNSEQLLFGTEDKGSQKSICALSSCGLINDLGYQIEKGKTLVFNNMLFPLLTLSAAGRIAEAYDISVCLEFDDSEIICGSTGITLKDTPPLLKDNSFLSSKNDIGNYAELGSFTFSELSDVTYKQSHRNTKNTHFPKPQSREIKKEVLEILEKFAHQTYAPATEESRLRGAGE